MASGRDITRRAAILAGFGGAGFLIANANNLTLSPRLRARISYRGGLDPDKSARAALS